MADFPNIEPDLEEIALIANNQTYDSILTGEFQSAGLSGAKWQCTPTFSNRNGKEARDLRSFIFNQEGVAGRFNYYPASIDNLGTHAGLGVVDGAGQVGKSLVTKGWDADQELLFAAGDYLTINGEMKMVTADVSVGQDYIEYDAVNYMPNPFDPSGWTAVSDPDGDMTNITLENPSGETFVGLLEQVGLTESSINNSAANKFNLPAGGTVYTAVIYKAISNVYIQMEVISDDGVESVSLYDVATNTRENGDATEFEIKDLGEGFYLIQQSKILATAKTGVYSAISMKNLGAPAPIGSQLYVQAAFFGKNPIEFPYSQYYQFNDGSEITDWNDSGATIAISGGLLSYIATNNDPQISKAAAFSGAKYSTVKVRWRRNAGLVSNQFFWKNNTGGYSIERSIFFQETTQDLRVTTVSDGDFYISIIDLSSSTNWTSEGNINGIRFDFGNSLASNFDIDYIEIYDPIAKEVYDDFWPAKLRANAAIPITPALRVSPSDENAIEVNNPYFPARLETDDQSRLQVSSPVIYNTSFSIVEDF